MKRKYIANARLFVTNEIASHVQLSEESLQTFLCLLLTFLNDFFVTGLHYLIGTKSRGNKKSWELIVAQKYCATWRLFVPTTFCFLILSNIKFPRLLVLKFCATISSTRLFVPRLFVPATFCSCDFLISNARKAA